ncbi:MAG: B12-binding domain-containing radical SAM protein [Desulfohalobiaceae bacterium]|nr:B12-binding domain-containing radical SAM protein [Desulfohalobiaceae bacterium]
MNILLIYPKYPETFWSFKKALKFVSKKAAFPPLGLLTVAAILPGDWGKRLVDLNITTLKQKDLEWADLVFVSGMLIQKESAREIIRLCREGGKTVVAGGPAFSAEPGSFPGVDHFVLNEAEITLPLFLKDLAEGRPQKMYTSDLRPDIRQTPVPLWSLIDLKKYATMPVQFSRGCPFDCEFCDIVILNGRKPRTKTPKQMITELQSLYDLGWKAGVFIVDDNFIGNKKKVKELLRQVIAWQKEHRYPFTLLTEASVDLAEDPELMDLMSAANFRKVFLGLETPCLESLLECGKKQNTKQDLAECVRIIHQHGMQVMGGFIVGFDSDTEKIFETQIDFIQRIGVATAMVGLLGAAPQTRLWHRLKAEGRLLQETSGDNTDGSLNFIPNMGRETLLQGYRKVVQTIYSPREYYARINTFVRNYNPKAKARLSASDIKAMIRSLWRIGIFSRSSLLYWKTIIKTFFIKIRALPDVIELAIYGHHFQYIAKKLSKKKGLKQ